MRGESGVVGAGQGEEGRGRSGMRFHSGSCVPVPARRRLEASPAALLRSRSSVWAASARLDEHRVAHPPIDEGLDVPRGLECRRRGLVRLAPLPAGAGVLDPTGAADQDEATDIQVRAGRDVQGHPGAERVAQEITPVGRR